MTSARAIEFRITQDLMERRGVSHEVQGSGLARGLICAVSLAGGMLLFGSVMPELLGALLAAGALAGLGSKVA